MVVMYAGVVAVMGSRIPRPPSVAGRWMMGIAWYGSVVCCVIASCYGVMDCDAYGKSAFGVPVKDVHR
jgi:hypothetical protein